MTKHFFHRLTQEETASETTSSTSDSNVPTYRLHVQNVDDLPKDTKSFVVLKDDNNNTTPDNLTQSRWMNRNENAKVAAEDKWVPSWADNSKAKQL